MASKLGLLKNNNDVAGIGWCSASLESNNSLNGYFLEIGFCLLICPYAICEWNLKRNIKK